MNPFFGRVLKMLGGILFLAALAVLIVWMLFKPDEKGRRVPFGFSVEPELMSIYQNSLVDASEVEFFRGLPHNRGYPSIDRDERRENEIFRMRGSYFYLPKFDVEPALKARLMAAMQKPTAISEWGGGKLCGGFHPDLGMRWQDASGETFEALICLGCQEIKLFGGGKWFYADLSNAYGLFYEIESRGGRERLLEEGLEEFLPVWTLEDRDPVALVRPIVGAFEGEPEQAFRFVLPLQEREVREFGFTVRLSSAKWAPESDPFRVMRYLNLDRAKIESLTDYRDLLRTLGSPTRLPIGGETSGEWAFDTVWWNLCAPISPGRLEPEKDAWQFFKIRVERKYLLDDPDTDYEIVKLDVDVAEFLELPPQ